MIICFFVFCGFCHAFLVLDNGVPRPGHEAEQAEIETTGSKAFELLRIMNQSCWAIQHGPCIVELSIKNGDFP